MKLVIGEGLRRTPKELASLFTHVMKAFYINCHEFFFLIVGAKWVGIPILRKKTLFCIFLPFCSVLFFVSFCYWSRIWVECRMKGSCLLLLPIIQLL